MDMLPIYGFRTFIGLMASLAIALIGTILYGLICWLGFWVLCIPLILGVFYLIGLGVDKLFGIVEE